MNTVGPRVRQIREQQKLTQEQFVARCNVQGWDITRATLAKIESRVRRVTDFEVLMLAKCLKVEVGELFCEVNQPY